MFLDRTFNSLKREKRCLTPVRFVVQEHHARQVHFDLRLEIAGVLKSWALPKGPSMDPSDKRLAVMVEDHPVQYFDFEGIIPAGYAGAGPVIVWDHGICVMSDGTDPEEALAKGKMVFELSGNVLKGGFSLVRMKGSGDKNWLLIKKMDAFSHPGWALRRALTKERERALQERVPPCQMV
jgi:bifunctional non-homologous end joining protein LigD